MTELIELKIKDPYRRLPKADADPGARERRVQAEIALKSAYLQAARAAARADVSKVRKLQDEIVSLPALSSPEHMHRMKKVNNRLAVEIDRVLAVHRANEYALEMLRIKSATKV